MKLIRVFLTLKNIPLKQIFWQFYRILWSTSYFKNLTEFDFFQKQVLISKSKYWAINSNYVFIFDSKMKHISSKLPCDVKNDYLYDFSYNYLDFIFSTNLLHDDVLNFIENYPNEGNRYEWHPYTASKRLINLVIFCVKNYDTIPKNKMKNFENQASHIYGFLQRNIEFHLGANHVLTNYAALSIGQSFAKKNANSIRYIDFYVEQYMLQFSKDIHYERSLSYSLQLLSEFLLVAQFYNELKNEFFYSMNSKIIASISKINSLGVMFGDNILEQTPNLKSVLKQFLHVYSRQPFEKVNQKRHDIEGYFFIDEGAFKLLVDTGEPSPKFNPGHAHDSTGALAILVENSELIVNGMVSTYERSDRRAQERSRLFYSKPQNVGVAQDTWASFRVAARRKPHLKVLKNGIKLNVKTSKTGFRRSIFTKNNHIVIKDRLLNSNNTLLVSQFIIGSDFVVGRCVDNKIQIIGKDLGISVFITFNKKTKVKVKKVVLGVGYAKTRAHEALIFQSTNRKLNLIIKG